MQKLCSQLRKEVPCVGSDMEESKGVIVGEGDKQPLRLASLGRNGDGELHGKRQSWISKEGTS